MSSNESPAGGGAGTAAAGEMAEWGYLPFAPTGHLPVVSSVGSFRKGGGLVGAADARMVREKGKYPLRAAYRPYRMVVRTTPSTSHARRWLTPNPSTKTKPRPVD